MDIQDLKINYCIDQKQVEKLEKLGLLNHITKKDGKRNFKTQDIQELMEMIHLMHLGMQDDELIQYCQYHSCQVDVLKQLRRGVINEIHDLQKKLDDIDFMIYQRKHRE